MFGRHVEKAKGIDFANTVLQRFNDKWEHRDGKTLLKVNIAHMFLSAQESDENKIISQLEYTLSYARENSKNSILLFNEELCKMYERSTYVFTQMKKAIENESFEIYFQPVYDCQLKKFTTAESLLRLFDDKGKMISPSEFIPIAEKCGLIDDISWIVMKKIFNFFKTYPDFHIQSISVNLSMQQLTDETFIKNILLWRDKYDVSLEQIRVEITERSIAENPQIVEKTMLQLTNEGMKFYLDDFGIGYSNLSNMISLPFETIKLDMSLVRDIDTKPKKYQIIEALSHMLHTAHFIIVAEGVETKEEAIKIHELNINRIQGFYYAKPMPEKEFVQFIEKMD